MNRRTFLTSATGLAGGGLALSFLGGGKAPVSGSACEDVETIHESEAEWRRLLTDSEFSVLREADTEPRGSSPLLEEHREGTFICAGCNQPLFRSQTKYDSGTGWPSFYQAIPCSVGTKEDRTLLFIVRTEYHCSRCGGHQGHIFDDGPPPTGKRYCNNGVALDFVPAGESLPPLRG